MPFRVRGRAGIRARNPRYEVRDRHRSLGDSSPASLKISPAGPVHFFLNSDEEVSSVAFRKEILAEAQARARRVGAGAGRGRWRAQDCPKGSGRVQDYRSRPLRSRRSEPGGRGERHHGTDPSTAYRAILARPRQGLTINVGRIEGGTRSNVVPERATAWIDVRIPRLQDRAIIERRDSRPKTL